MNAQRNPAEEGFQAAKEDNVRAGQIQKTIEGINTLNAKHNAGIRGGLIKLFYGDRFTKEECKFIEENID